MKGRCLVKKFLTLAAVATLSLLGSSLAAPYVAPDDNLSGVTLCIDNNSFQAKIGGLTTTSSTVAQTSYDYFVAQATAKKIPFKEMGDKSCVDWAVNLDFGATVGTPRAWYGDIWISDDGAYASLNAADLYRKPVIIWEDSSFGVLPDNDGITAYLVDEGKSLVDSLLTSYKKVN
jgi:hypothetical protein